MPRALFASLLLVLPLHLGAEAVQAAADPKLTTTFAADSQGAIAPVEGVDIEALLARMSLEQKVGQLLFVDVVGQKMNPGIRELIAHKMVGGVALFGHNIRNRTQVRRLLTSIYRAAPDGVPPFISVDQEGGRVTRIDDPESVLPSAMALGATRSVEMAETAGRVVGGDLRSLGVTMNLAPVLDVNSNPDNPVIGIRSFGADPELVADLGSAFIRGLQKARVIAVAKHFPGHGATKADSHYSLPSLPHDLERLRRVEFVPFARAIDGGLEALMTAHIALPRVAEKPELPATMSRRIMTGALREELGFDGLVITDGLEMRGIVETYGLGKAAVQAILAGADMVLVVWTSQRKNEVRKALIAAVRSGEISPARLDQSVRRILRTKARYHIFPSQRFDPLQVAAEDRFINDRIALRAATLVRNQGKLLPLHPRRHQRVLVASPMGRFRNLLDRRLEGASVQQIPLAWAPDRPRRKRDRLKVLAAAEQADVVVLGISNGYYARLARALKSRYPKTPVVVVSFGSPYMLAHFSAIDAYLCMYSDRHSAQVAAAETLVGANHPRGKLPVDLPGLYPFGHGLSYPDAETPDRQGHAEHAPSGQLRAAAALQTEAAD